MASEPIDRLMADAEHAADMIRKAKDVLIVAHIDADGITSAAIASKTCERLGKEPGAGGSSQRTGCPVELSG